MKRMQPSARENNIMKTTHHNSNKFTGERHVLNIVKETTQHRIRTKTPKHEKTKLKLQENEVIRFHKSIETPNNVSTDKLSGISSATTKSAKLVTNQCVFLLVCSDLRVVWKKRDREGWSLVLPTRIPNKIQETPRQPCAHHRRRKDRVVSNVKSD